MEDGLRAEELEEKLEMDEIVMNKEQCLEHHGTTLDFSDKNSPKIESPSGKTSEQKSLKDVTETIEDTVNVDLKDKSKKITKDSKKSASAKSPIEVQSEGPAIF